jgi:hypothetical protein
MSFGHVSERSNLELLRCRAYALVWRYSTSAFGPEMWRLVWRA